MRISSYYQKIIGACSVLLILIIGLSVVLYNQGPRVRLVQFSDPPKSTSLSKGSTLTLGFDRPIEQKDYTDLVLITPELEFTVATSTQNITLSLDENLSHNTDYSVTLLPGVVDKSGKQMQAKYEYSFSTDSPSYAYIQRNYGIDYDREASFISSDTDDHVMVSMSGSEPVSVFSHPEIRSIVANRDYVVVVVKEDDQDELFTVDLNTETIRQESLSLNGRIHSLTLSPRGQNAVFSIKPDFNSVSTEYYESFAYRAQSLNVATGEIIALTNEAGEAIKAIDILMDNDGQVALVQNQAQAYFAISPFNDYEPTLIGTYDASFGFDDNASAIAFRDREDLVLYDIVSAEVSPIDLGNDGFIRGLSARSGDIFASSSSFVGGLTNSRIASYADWQSEAEIVWRSTEGDKSTLNGFAESYDSNLLAIQQNPELCRYDSIGTNSQCTEAQTMIFDISKQEVTDTFDGFDIVWLP